MARKSAKSSDHSIVFDTRINAVMASGKHDGIREKVQAVKEIVTDKTNDEISIVLQYYDNSVEQTIQAFLDDGAKDALNEWHLPTGTKTDQGQDQPSNKRKKKNKKAKEGAAKASAPQDSTPVPSSSTVITAPAPSGGKPSNRSNIGSNSHIKGSSVIKENGSSSASSSSSSKVQLSNGVRSQDSSSFMASLDNSELSKQLSTATTTDISTTTTNGHLNSLDVPNSAHSPSATATTVGGVSSSSLSSTVSSLSSSSTGLNGYNARTGVASLDQAAKAALGNNSTTTTTTTTTAAAANTKDTPLSANTDFKLNINAAASAGHSGQAQDAVTKRPKTFDATTGSHTASHGHHGKKAAKTPRERTFSEQSDHTGGKRPHGGLEKSTKDLHRQSVSLQRLKSVMNEGIEKSTKSTTKMFQELRDALNTREAQILVELERVKIVANDTMTQRQHRAVQLKERIPRAAIMSEQELAELRADIKHFVSDRKIDEELGSTTRFMADFDVLKQEIMDFGEVTPVKATYSHRRPSISSVTSSVVSHDDLQSPLSPLTPLTPVTPSIVKQAPAAIQLPLGPQSGAARVITQSESVTRYEATELQNRLLGIKPEAKPEDAKSAETNRGNPKAGGLRPHPGDQKLSRNARRRLKVKERQKEEKQRQREESRPAASADGADKPNQGRGGPRRDKPKAHDGGSQSQPTSKYPEARKPQQYPEARKPQQAQPSSNAAGRPRQGTPRNTPSPSKDGKDHSRNDSPRKGNQRRTPSPTKKNPAQAPEGSKSDTQQPDQKNQGQNKGRNRGPRPRSQSGSQRGGKAVTVSVSETEGSVKKVEVSADLEQKSQSPKSAEVSVALVDNVKADVPQKKTEDAQNNNKDTVQVDPEQIPEHTNEDPLPQRKPRQRDRPAMTKDNNENVTSPPLMNGDIKMNGDLNGDVNGLHE